MLRLPKIKYINFFNDRNLLLNHKKHIFTQILKKFDDGTFISTIANDSKKEEGETKYHERSFSEFRKLLRNSSLHIYVDKTKKTSNDDFFVQGHISGFLTDFEGEVIEDSFISLRPNKLLESKLVFRLPNDDNNRKDRNTHVYTIEFSSFEGEFKKHLFKFNDDQDVDYLKDRKRYLIGVPISLVTQKLGFSNEDLVTLVTQTKEAFKDKKYILADGSINGEFTKALNCVTAFYSANGVNGTEANASPQMAAWSYLELILGDAMRKQLIDGSGLRGEHGEREHDDKLFKK